MPVITGALRRLPVYFILDCSDAMAGAPLLAVQHLLIEIHQHLLDDPQARESTVISVILFNEMAAQDALEEVDSFVPPSLTTAPGRSFGAALHLLRESLQQDLVPSTATRRGDYHPVVFIVLAGPPTDMYQIEIQALRLLKGPQRPTFVGLAYADAEVVAALRLLTDDVLAIGDLSLEVLRHLFTRARREIITISRGALPRADASPLWLGNPLDADR